MDSDDLSLCLQHLGLTASDLAELVAEDVSRVHRWISGAESVPRTIDLLTYYWCEFPGALEMAQEATDAHPMIDEAATSAKPAKIHASLQ